MAQPCTAILIDPFTQTVSEVTWNGDYRHIYELIGADCYDCCRINKQGDAIFVDDEGLFKEEQMFFVHEDYPSPLAGKGLILGCDHEGESVKPHTTLEEAKAKIAFGYPVRIGEGMAWVNV